MGEGGRTFCVARLPACSIVAGSEFSDHVIVAFPDEEVRVVNVGSVAPRVIVDVFGDDSCRCFIFTGLDLKDLVAIGFCAFDAIHIGVVEVVRFERIAVFTVYIDVDVSVVGYQVIDCLMVVCFK